MDSIHLFFLLEVKVEFIPEVRTINGLIVAIKSACILARWRQVDLARLGECVVSALEGI